MYEVSRKNVLESETKKSRSASVTFDHCASIFLITQVAIARAIISPHELSAWTQHPNSVFSKVVFDIARSNLRRAPLKYSVANSVSSHELIVRPIHRGVVRVGDGIRCTPQEEQPTLSIVSVTL